MNKKDTYIDELTNLNEYIGYMNDTLSYNLLKVSNEIDNSELKIAVRKLSFFKQIEENNDDVLDDIKVALEKSLNELNQNIENVKTIKAPRLSKKVNWLLNVDGGNLRKYVFSFLNIEISDLDHFEINKLLYEKLDNLNADIIKELCEENYLDKKINGCKVDYEKVLDKIKFDTAEIYKGYCYNKIYDVENLINQIKLYNGGYAINVYKQAFITLMTIFEATIKDMFRCLFKNNFYCVYKYINNTIKEDLKEYNTFDEMVEKIVNKYVDEKYISQIIEVLKKYNKDLFVDNMGVDMYSDVVELISRRNIHIHNKGNVDQKYLQKTSNAYLKGYKMNDFLPINFSYYIHATRITQKIVEKIDLYLNENL